MDEITTASRRMTPEETLLAYLIAADPTAAAGITPEHVERAKQQLTVTLETLKPKLAQTWLYVHAMGLSVEETTERLGYKTDKTIRRHLREAMEDLAEELGITLPPLPEKKGKPVGDE